MQCTAAKLNVLIANLIRDTQIFITLHACPTQSRARIHLRTYNVHKLLAFSVNGMPLSSTCAWHGIYLARIKSYVPRMSVCEESLEGEGNNVVPRRGPTGEKKRVVGGQKAAKGLGGLNFQTVQPGSSLHCERLPSLCARDRWIKNNGNVEFSVARLLLRRLFSIAENNKKCINRMLAAAGDDTPTSTTRQPKARGRAARIIKHRSRSISCSMQTSLY